MSWCVRSPIHCQTFQSNFSRGKAKTDCAFRYCPGPFQSTAVETLTTKNASCWDFHVRLREFFLMGWYLHDRPTRCTQSILKWLYTNTYTPFSSTKMDAACKYASAHPSHAAVTCRHPQINPRAKTGQHLRREHLESHALRRRPGNSERKEPSLRRTTVGEFIRKRSGLSLLAIRVGNQVWATGTAEIW